MKRTSLKRSAISRKPKRKRCQICNELFQPANSFAVCCSVPCAIVFSQSNGKVQIQKDRLRSDDRKANNRAKKALNQTDLTVRRKAAVKACHKYIRERDKNSTCICCGEPLQDGYQAGHWLESGNNPQTRFDERNIHAQNIRCNYYKGGDSGDYERNLRIKIGDAAVDELLTTKGGTVKRTAQDYLEIESHYKGKLKSLLSV